MMTVMLTQAPLPLLPAGATEIAPGVGVVTSADGGGVVWVHGLVTFCWDGGDGAGRRRAAVEAGRPEAAPEEEGPARVGGGPLTAAQVGRGQARGRAAA